jgi:DNA-binding NarL/FixJ family response regulator
MRHPPITAASGRKTGVTDEPSGSATIRVYLLDDHEVVRRGVRDLLEAESDITVVGEADSALVASRRIPALRPHVAILDARLPDGSGIEVCREIRSKDPTIAALILTSYDDDEALFSAIMAGASGFLLKRAWSGPCAGSLPGTRCSTRR